MWIYNNAEFIEPSAADYGFVYCITNLETGRRYIGKKLFWNRKTRQVKGKKKRYLAESDWRDYYGSNDELKSDIEKSGIDKFSRVILYLCPSKGECNYMEAKVQFDLDVLRHPNDFYNNWIMVRTHRKHLKL